MRAVCQTKSTSKHTHTQKIIGLYVDCRSVIHNCDKKHVLSCCSWQHLTCFIQKLRTSRLSDLSYQQGFTNPSLLPVIILSSPGTSQLSTTDPIKTPSVILHSLQEVTAGGTCFSFTGVYLNTAAFLLLVGLMGVDIIPLRLVVP